MVEPAPRPLFQERFLIAGSFPRLDETGLSECRHEIETQGFPEFLENGWLTLRSRDPILTELLETFIHLEQEAQSASGKSDALIKERYHVHLDLEQDLSIIAL